MTLVESHPAMHFLGSIVGIRKTFPQRSAIPAGWFRRFGQR